MLVKLALQTVKVVVLLVNVLIPPHVMMSTINPLMMVNA